MAKTSDETARARRRTLRRGERSKLSLLQIFRAAHFARDAKVASGKSAGGEAEITRRSRERRDGVDETTLKMHVQADLGALMNTIQLGAAVDLDDAPHVRHSVLNYGFRDLSDITTQDLGSPDIIASIRQSLLDHEPRLIPETIEIRVADRTGNERQRLEISVSAELMADPIDVPIDFDAEVDLGSGKLRMRSLKVQS